MESRIDFQGSIIVEDAVPDNGSFTSHFSETGNLQLESGIDIAVEDGTIQVFEKNPDHYYDLLRSYIDDFMSTIK